VIYQITAAVFGVIYDIVAFVFGGIYNIFATVFGWIGSVLNWFGITWESVFGTAGEEGLTFGDVMNGVFWLLDNTIGNVIRAVKWLIDGIRSAIGWVRSLFGEAQKTNEELDKTVSKNPNKKPGAGTAGAGMPEMPGGLPTMPGGVLGVQGAGAGGVAISDHSNTTNHFQLPPEAADNPEMFAKSVNKAMASKNRNATRNGQTPVQQ